MNKIPSVLVAAVAAFSFLASASPAKAVSLPLTNSGFDDAGSGTGGNGFDASGADVTGWRDAGTNPGGGVYVWSGSQTQPNAAYTGPNQSGAFQLTNYVIQAGDVFTLTYYAMNGYQNTKASVHLIETTNLFTGASSGASQSNAYSATAIIATSQPTTTGLWAQYTVTYTATAADAGKIVGIEFDSATGGYPNYDTFALGVTHPFVHPGLLHSQSDIDRMRATYTVTPYSTTWPSWLSAPDFSYSNNGQGSSQGTIANDAAVAGCNAVSWVVTGDTRYLNNSISIMNRYAQNMTAFDVNNHLLAGAAANDFCNAGELIRATGNGAWAASDIAAFQNMLTTYLLPALLTPGNNYAGVNHMGSDGVLEAAGHGIVQIQGLVPMGIFCDRPDIYSMGVISAERNASTSYGLLEYIPAQSVGNGQNFETARDQGHASGALGTYTVIGYALWNQGIDLFALGNNRLALAYEAQEKISLGYEVSPVSWTAADGSSHNSINATYETSTDGTQPFLAYRIYNGVKGLQMPYTYMSQTLRGVDVVQGIYPAGSGTPVPATFGAPAPHDVVLFADSGFAGDYLVHIGPGNWTKSALNAAGVGGGPWGNGSNTLRSIKVPAGWTVTLYNADNFTGSSVVVTSNNSQLGSVGFDQSTVSLTVTAGTQPYQIWKGTYQLVSLSSGKVAEIPGSSTANGTALDQTTYTGAPNQLWCVQPQGNGQYLIQNLSSNLAMEVSGASLTQGTSLDQWTYTPEQNLATGGTATASADNAANGEGAAQAFDGNVNTKWNDPVNGGTGWLQYQFPTGTVVDHYTLTSANDVQGRDPAAWQFQGSSDGMNWTTLDTESGQYFWNRYLTLPDGGSYSFTNNTAYKYYRLNMTANNGGSGYSLQLSELSFYSSMTGLPSQRWTIAPVAGSAFDTYFNLLNCNSNQLMDVYGASQNNGASIIQWPSNNGHNQQWSFQLP